MRKVMMMLVLLISTFSYGQLPPQGNQKPLTWNDGNFPSTMYHVYQSDNVWMEEGLSIYSMFMVDNKYYASGESIVTSNQLDVVGFRNTGADSIYSIIDPIPYNIGKEPVKTGFDYNEQVYWGLWNGVEMKKLMLISTYTSRAGETAIFNLTGETIEVLDNPYWSIDPVWPIDTTLKIKKPTATNKTFYLYNLAYPGTDGRLYYPKYLLKLQWEIVEGTTTVTNSYDKRKDIYFLNQAKFRFTKADIDKGYILVKLKGTVHINSGSTNTSKVYKIYW